MIESEMRSRSPSRRGLRYSAIAVVGAILLGVGAWLVSGCARGGGDGDGAALQRDFRPPEPYDLSALLARKDYTCAATDGACARSYLSRLTRRHGPRAALAVLGELKSSGRVEDSVDDHLLAHVVGRATAERFGANGRSFQLCPNEFNYGCPHGFFEFVLGRTGTPKHAARLICESAGRGRVDAV